LRIPFIRRFLTGSECLSQVLWLSIEGATTHRWD